MSSIRARSDNGKLFFDFRYRSIRLREATTLDDTPANRAGMQKVLNRIEAEVTLGTFEYRRYFPNSANAAKFELNTAPPAISSISSAKAPLFSEFVKDWWTESEVRWRQGTKDSMAGTVNGRLVPRFGSKSISDITRQDILTFRAELAKGAGRRPGSTLSPKTVNQAITVLKAILDEAAHRFGFLPPTGKITRLKVPKKDIEPFSLEEVWKLAQTIRADFRPYVTVRFLTGMRSGEINGLKWHHIDWERRQILVRETFTHGRTEYTKNDGSQREIDMSSQVLAALREQEKVSKGKSEYVFCNRDWGPIDAKNFANRVWAPLLRLLALKVRRPYQTRHTCATLWLAAGENPLWIAKQLGHSTPEMLFKVYSRFVPNLTHKDGSAFDRLIKQSQGGSQQPETAA